MAPVPKAWPVVRRWRAAPAFVEVAAATALLRTTAAASGAEYSGAGIEVPLERRSRWGLFRAKVHIGTPPQSLEVQIDSGSPSLWIPEAHVGSANSSFTVSKSTTAAPGEAGARQINYSDGLCVEGRVYTDTVSIGDTASDRMPMLVATNASGGPLLANKGEVPGTLGLVSPRGIDDDVESFGVGAQGRPHAWSFLHGFEEESDEEERQHVESFFQKFWEQHPSVPRAFLLELGGASPRMVIGEPGVAGARAQGGVEFLAQTFTERSALWYTSVRAIGFSYREQESKDLRWNYDFNEQRPWGAPALLDTGAAAIRVRKATYDRMLRALPRGCTREETTTGMGTTTCECSSAADEETFPSISISFESINTTRFLGLDTGNDVIVCVPPSAYVGYNDKTGRCDVALVDAGESHTIFGYEALVLGVPFFQSVSVVLDLENRRVGVGAALAPQDEARVVSLVADDAAECPCADPKNWWATGHRLSMRRVALVLALAAALALYVFLAHSQTAIALYFRSHGERLCGGAQHALGSLGGGGPSMAGQGGHRGAAGASPDRPFVEMPSRRGQE